MILKLNAMAIDKKQELIGLYWQSCLTGIRSFKATAPRAWLEEHGLNYNDLELGFSSGQYSHRKTEEQKQALVGVGILTPSTAAVRSPELKAYTCFGTYAIVFPLKDERGAIINFYSIRLKTKIKAEEYLNEGGIYPSYPNPMTRRLFIASTVMDATSLIQSKVMENRDSVIALFNGELKQQHIEAINKLNHLQQIIFIQ